MGAKRQIRPPQNEHLLQTLIDGKSYLLENSCSLSQDPSWVKAQNYNSNNDDDDNEMLTNQKTVH